MADKSGGDVNQANVGNQGNVNLQDLTGVASAGAAAVDSLGGAAGLGQLGAQAVGQNLGQLNLGQAGSAGDDNTQADTNIQA